MKKIRIYLQYPWKLPDSPYYKSLIRSPPKNVEFLNITNQRGAMTNPKKVWISNILKKVIRNGLNFARKGLINAHLTKTSEKYELIQCAHCLSLNDSPWVADFECGWQFFVGKETKRNKKKAETLMLSNNCKKLLAWTEETKKEMMHILPSIEKKIEVVYPAIPLPKFKRKKHKEINLVFVARYFDQKGGYHALEVMKKITQKYKFVRGIIVSQVPKSVIEENRDNKQITFYPLMPQEEVFKKVYSIGDISVYPGYADSFGFGILESMSFGIPVVSVEGYARREVITEGKTGFVVKSQGGKKEKFGLLNWKETRSPASKAVIDQMVQKVSLLIKDQKLRTQLSKNCMREVTNGKFSIKKRNKKLEEIYASSI